MNAPHYDLLLKEIELIHSGIKNLDDLIHKTKNFAVVLWGGSISVILGQMGGSTDNASLFLLLTAVIPVLFWIMDFNWRRHLRLASEREKIISRFINGPAFKEWLATGETTPRFPLYDTVGWIYTTDMQGPHEFGEAYLVDRARAGFWKVLLYKEAKLFYPIMIVLSLVLGFSMH